MSRVAFNFHNALTRWEFSPFALLVLAAAIVAASWYLRAEWSLSTRGRRWSGKRTASFMAGLVALVVALQSPVSTFTMDYFQAHVIQHLLLMVIAPPLLAMGAPMTLALQTSSRSAKVRLLGHPQLPAVQGAHPPASGLVPLLLLDVRLLPDLRPRFRHDPHVGHGPDQPGLLLGVDAVLVAHRRRRPGPPLEDEPRGEDGATCSSGCRWSRSWPWPSSARPGPPPPCTPLGSTHSGAGILWIGAELFTFLALIPVFVQWVRFEERKGARFDAQQDAEMAAQGIQAVPASSSA